MRLESICIRPSLESVVTIEAEEVAGRSTDWAKQLLLKLGSSSSSSSSSSPPSSKRTFSTSDPGTSVDGWTVSAGWACDLTLISVVDVMLCSGEMFSFISFCKRSGMATKIFVDKQPDRLESAATDGSCVLPAVPAGRVVDAVTVFSGEQRCNGDLILFVVCCCCWMCCCEVEFGGDCDTLDKSTHGSCSLRFIDVQPNSPLMGLSLRAGGLSGNSV